ncbi:hypothetical protein [Geothrix campi]|uniref:hypothetical protein n=1 Tax=Geothrix campi TaxID=2966450 RepID=UPI002147832A|nr:hypothetical protein [Geothrix sp. SG10]
MCSSVGSTSPQDQPDNFDETALRRHKRRLREQAEHCGRPLKAIASGMGLADQSQLTRWLQDQYRDSMGSHWVEAWTREVGHGYLNYINSECEHAHSHAHQTAEALAALFIRMAGKQAGQTIEHIHSGGVYTGHEKQIDLPGWLKIQSVVGQIIEDLEREGAEGGRS